MRTRTCSRLGKPATSPMFPLQVCNDPRGQEPNMSTTATPNQTTTDGEITDHATARAIDMKLEIVVIPVSVVDRAKRFYVGLGWRLDADFAKDDGFRVVQLTPPGSSCSLIIGSKLFLVVLGLV